MVDAARKESKERHKCKYCEKTFLRPSYRDEHQANTCKQRPNANLVTGYQCTSREHAYAAIDKLSFFDHVRYTHQNISYTCQNCNKSFSNFSSAKNHSKGSKKCTNPTKFKRPQQSEIDKAVSEHSVKKTWTKK